MVASQNPPGHGVVSNITSGDKTNTLSSGRVRSTLDGRKERIVGKEYGRIEVVAAIIANFVLSFYAIGLITGVAGRAFGVDFSSLDVLILVLARNLWRAKVTIGDVS